MKLVSAIRRELRARADEARAPQMQAYMKSEMPFLGVPMPEHRAFTRALVNEHPPANAAEWRAAVELLWREATHREERYCAIHVARHRRGDPFQEPKVLALYEELVVAGAWWDLVDAIAPYRIGELLQRFPAPIAKRLRTWSRSGNLWKRRASIIAQLKAKERTDFELLAECLEPSLESEEFFLRMAIGWALREHGKTDPASVLRYVDRHRDRMAPLSVREATRNLD